MAAYWKSGGGLMNVGKRVLAARLSCCSPIPTTTLLSPSSSLSYSSSNDPLSAAYEKIPDDHAPQSVVPNELIQPVSEEYWAPDPRTGVFSPHSDHSNNPTEHGDSGAHPSGSVLEEEPFFRSTSVEDLEKPIILPDQKVDE